MNNARFSFSRFLHLIWMDARFWARPLGLGAVATALGVVLLSFLAAFSRGGSHFHAEMYGWILGLGGLVFTSRAFLELRYPLATQHFLLVPASLEEKFLARYVISSVGYVAISLTGYLLVQLVSEGLNLFLLGRTNPLFFPDNLRHLQFFAAYMAIQSLFFAGAVYFRKYAFLKTWFFLTGMFFLFALFVYGVFRIFLAGYFHGMQPRESVLLALAQMGVSGELGVVFYTLRTWADWVLRIFFWGVMPLCALAFAYFRLRETEV